MNATFFIVVSSNKVEQFALNKATISGGCEYVYDELIPVTAVAVHVIGDDYSVSESYVLVQVLENGWNLKETRHKRGECPSKNTVRVREQGKHPEYRCRQNERRREQRSVKNDWEEGPNKKDTKSICFTRNGA